MSYRNLACFGLFQHCLRNMHMSVSNFHRLICVSVGSLPFVIHPLKCLLVISVIWDYFILRNLIGDHATRRKRLAIHGSPCPLTVLTNALNISAPIIDSQDSTCYQSRCETHMLLNRKRQFLVAFLLIRFNQYNN